MSLKWLDCVKCLSKIVECCVRILDVRNGCVKVDRMMMMMMVVVVIVVFQAREDVSDGDEAQSIGVRCARALHGTPKHIHLFCMTRLELIRWAFLTL